MLRIVVLFIVLTVISCKTKDVRKFKDKDMVVSLSKSPCFGKCSVYSLKVFKNRYVVYDGKMNALRYGIYSKKLTKEAMLELTSVIEGANLFSFEDNYPSDLVDFPLITISYQNDKGVKTISGRQERPKPIQAVQHYLEKIANSEQEWTLVEAAEPQISDISDEEIDTSRQPKADDFIDNEIIIEPSPRTGLALWFRKYSAYNVRLITKVAPELNLWLITFDKSKIDPNDLLRIIKDDKDILKAEFNKRVSTRGH